MPGRMCTATDVRLTTWASSIAFFLIGGGGAGALLQAYGILPAPVDSGAIAVFILCILILLVLGETISFGNPPRP